MFLTLADIQAFINFVNGNLGKKLFTDALPTSTVAGQKLLTTGVGLGVELVDDISTQLGIAGTWDMSTLLPPVGVKIGERYFVGVGGTLNGVAALAGDVVEFVTLTSIFVYPLASTLVRLTVLDDYATKVYAESLVVGLIDDRGGYDPTVTSAYPTSADNGSGTAGVVLKGDLWFFSANGTCGANTVLTGYSVRALVDNPGQTDSNWNVLNVGLGYVPENVANKKTSLNGGLTSPDDITYPTTLVVDDALNLKADILDQTHTGAMRLPSSLKIYDTVAPTKEVAVDVSGLTAGAPRTVTFPDRNIALGDLPLFAATTNYRQYAIIQQDGLLYSAKVAFTSGVSFSVADWDSIGGVLKSQVTGNQSIVSGYEYFIVASPNVAITLETPDPTLVPDGSRIVIHNLAFTAVATLGKTNWTTGTGFAVAPSFDTVATATIPSYSKGATTVLTSRQSTGVWVKETTYGSTIPVGTTVDAGKAYFAREDDVTATVSFNLGNIPAATNTIVTFPNANVDFGRVSTSVTYSATTGVLAIVNADTSTNQNLALAPLEWTNIAADTVSTTMVAGLNYLASNTATGKTYTLPATPSIGQVVQIRSTTFAAFKQTVARNGQTIDGAAANYLLTRNGTYRFLFNASSTWESEYVEETRLQFFRPNTYYPALSVIHNGLNGMVFNPSAVTTGATYQSYDWSSLATFEPIQSITSSQTLTSGVTYNIGNLGNSGVALASAITLTLPQRNFAQDNYARQEPIRIYFGNTTSIVTLSASDATTLGIVGANGATGATTLVLPANMRGMVVTLYPFFNVTLTQIGWRVHYECGQEMRMGSTSPFRFAKDGATDAFMRFELGALSTGTKVVTFPDRDVDLGLIGNAPPTYTASVVYAAGQLVTHQGHTWKVIVAHTGAIPFVNGNLELVGSVFSVIAPSFTYACQRLSATALSDRTYDITLAWQGTYTIDLNNAPRIVTITNTSGNVNIGMVPTRVTLSRSANNGFSLTSGSVAVGPITVDIPAGATLRLLNYDTYTQVLTSQLNAAGSFKIWDASTPNVATQKGWLFSGTATAGRNITLPDVDLDLGELATVYSPLINTQSTAITAYTLGTVTTDNNGKTYLRMTATAANTVTVPSTQTKPINISQRGIGATTLVAGASVVLTGNVNFTDVNQTKTLIPLGLLLGTYYFDIIG